MPELRNVNDRQTQSVVAIRNWHVVLVVLTWLVLATAAFTNLRAQGDENERRILNLEQRSTVSLSQYHEGQQMLKDRLDRIERKLDARR